MATSLGQEEDHGCSHDSKKAALGGEPNDVEEHSIKPSSSNDDQDSSNCIKEDDAILESTKAEMGDVRKENEKLKMMLQRIEKDYNSLKLRFFDIIQQESNCNIPNTTIINEHKKQQDLVVEEEPEQLVSLCLGRSSTSQPSIDQTKNQNTTRNDIDGNEEFKNSLTLGLRVESSELVSSNPSPEGSFKDMGDEESAPRDNRQSWPSSSSKRNNNGDDSEVSQQSHVKKARVCVRARCDTPTMNDGCQWRKYGQKIAKGNPCPRAYYRCTVAPACPVRKQVQRCAEDMSILITTYEGNHNHPLPISATSMASTTSAAASMLLSGSSTSQGPGLGSTGSHVHINAATNEVTNGFNFGHYNDNTRPKQFYLPNTNTTASSTLFPTITLDLTTPPSNAFSRFPTRFPSTSLSFSSNEHHCINLPTIGKSGFQNSTYNSTTTTNIPFSTTLLGKQDHFQNSYIDKTNSSGLASQQVLTDTLTKAITSDPSFRTVIATAISSMINSNNNGVGGGGGTSSSSLLQSSSSPFGTVVLNSSSVSTGNKEQKS